MITNEIVSKIMLDGKYSYVIVLVWFKELTLKTEVILSTLYSCLFEMQTIIFILM